MHHLGFRRSRYALAALVVAGALGAAACVPAKPPPPPTGVSISPTSKNFGSLGVSDPASTAQTFTVKNNGSVPSGVLTAALGPNFNPGEFALSANTCTGNTVPAGGTCSVDAKFDPTAVGQKLAQLVVTSANASDGTASALLSGTGT